MVAGWKPEWNIGQPGVDEDHQRQYTLMRKFINLPTDDIWRDDAAKILKDLRTLSVSHFAREEKLQKAIRYPNLAEHHDQHVRLLAMLDEMIGQIDQDNALFSFSYVKDRSDRLLQFWFLEHFAKSDMQLKVYVAKVLARL